MKNKKDIWRNKFHIQPPTGLLNDPNGLVYHNGEYHVFYQWHPDAPEHGLKFWNHVKSTDLVSWQFDERLVMPDTPYDKDGAYSGSAIVNKGQVELYYTGNTRNLQGIRHPYQVKAELGAKEVVNKRVIIDGIPKAYTEHFRDPKVIKKADIYYMIIGAQRENLTGAALMYTSKDSENWEFAYEVKTEYEDLGYMWECPDLTQVEGKDVLLFCPQGSMNTPIEKENLYPSVYLLGDYNFETGYFNNDKAVEKLDYGFDFYAAQTFSDENNDTVLIAWVGMPEIAYPSDKFGWAHVLTLPRKLKVIDGVLHQIPHPNLKKLRDRKITSLENVSLYELKINDIKESLEIQLYSKDNESLKLTYNKEERKVILDRSNFKETFGEKYGQMREIYMRNDLKSIHVFRDTSTIEIFLNNGEYTMTARFFPQIIEGDIIIEPQVQAEVYLLKEDIHDL